MIVKQYCIYWDARINPNATRIPAQAMVSIMNEIRTMLKYSYVVDFDRASFNSGYNHRAITPTSASSESPGVEHEVSPGVNHEPPVPVAPPSK